MIAQRVMLPVLALLSGVALWLIQSKLLVAPVIMLVVWPYWLGLLVGLILTLRYNFLAGVAAASAISAGLLMALDFAHFDWSLIGTALYAPVLPLALVQLIAAPFQIKSRPSAGAEPVPE